MTRGTSAQGPGPGPSYRSRAGIAQGRQRANRSPRSHPRKRGLMTVTVSVGSALVMLAAGCGWLLTGYINGHLRRVNADTSQAGPAGPVNILLAGVDVREGLTKRQERVLHVGSSTGQNSDTLMLAHVSADHRHISVVSLPRDSWVRIPGHGMNKINAAFGLGGPALMVRTVEAATGMTINDFVEVNFLGFVKIIDALGGVDICLPFAVHDHYSGLYMSAGMHHVNGITALKFARDRHSFATSDLARIGDQQQLLSSVLSEAISSGTLTNPVKFSRFLSAVTSATKVDQSFNVTGLADELRYIRPSAVSFTTVPLANTNYLAPSGELAVLWNRAKAAALFARIKSDRRVVAHHHHGRHHGRSGQPTVWQVKPRTAAQAACRKHH